MLTCNVKQFHYYRPEAAFVATGIEAKAAKDSGVAVVYQKDVEKLYYADALKIIVKESSGNLKTYPLLKYERSNASTCVNQRPIVSTRRKALKRRCFS